MACSSCAEKAGFKEFEEQLHGVWLALVYGGGVAVAGLAASVAVNALTGWTIPVFAIGIGYVVGQAVKKGAHGLGGGRFALTAALLTYLSIAFATGSTGVTRALMQSISEMNWWEHAAAWGMLALFSPIIELIRGENGVFAFLALGAGMLIAARQTFVQSRSVFGPYFQDPQEDPV